MFDSARKALIALMMAGGLAAPAVAADYSPPVEEAPPPPVVEAAQFGGWYIRGDIDYHKSKFKGADYITYGISDPCLCGPQVPVPGSKSFDSGKLKGAFSLGGGVGYKINQYFRTDVTADY